MPAGIQNRAIGAAKGAGIIRSRDQAGKNLKYSPASPYAFTEHGALMAANVLNSEQATSMSVYIVRAFVRLRETILRQTHLVEELGAEDFTGVREVESLCFVFPYAHEKRLS